MAYHGYNPFLEIGSQDLTTLEDHTVLMCAYNGSAGRFELYLSDLPNGGSTAFKKLRLYSGSYPADVDAETFLELDVDDATISNVGSITLDAVVYHSVNTFYWTLAEDPLEGITEFTARFERFTAEEQGEEFEGTVWWPHLDFGNLGVNKQLIGLDLVSDAPLGLTASIGYDQTDLTSRTTPYAIDADTLPGMLIPFPVSGPSFDLKLVFTPGQRWEIQAANFYLQDRRVTS